MNSRVPEWVMEKAAALWRGVDQDKATLEQSLHPRNNQPVYFVLVEGVRVARMVIAGENFPDPISVIHPADPDDTVLASSPMWYGWNQRLDDNNTPEEFEYLKESVRQKRFVLVSTMDFPRMIYLIYHLLDLNDGVTAFCPAAEILEDGSPQA